LLITRYISGERTDTSVKHVHKRDLFDGVGRVFTGITCAIVDDILGVYDCDGGE